MEKEIKFKIAAFVIRRTIACKKCVNFNARQCPILNYLLDNDEISVTGDSREDTLEHPTFAVSMDDMALAWQAHRRCKQIATKCNNIKTK